MSLKILTVDDSKTIRKIMIKAFQPYDCVVLEAENGVEGLSVALREKPDLIILDLTMPVMTGIEMLEKLRAEDSMKKTPVIMLTAESGKEVVTQIIKLGVAGYVVKPFENEQLLEKVQKSIDLKPKPTSKHFIKEDGIDIIDFPAAINTELKSEISNCFDSRVKEGMNKLIFKFTSDAKFEVNYINFLIQLIGKCQKNRVALRMVGCSAATFQGYQETASVPVDGSLADATAALQKK